MKCGISKMKFTSLNEAFANSFIKSLPVLTRLNLTANEIKLIELVLSYTRNGQDFFMNYAAIADYLVVGNTKDKAKTVGNIVRSLKKKGYITTIQTHNFNGKNGGSSVKIAVDENYLEQQLHRIFNMEVVADQNTPQVSLPLEGQRIKMAIQNPIPSQTNDDFIAELEAMENEEQILPTIATPSDSDKMGDALQNVVSILKETDTVEGFNSMLKLIMGEDYFHGKKSALLYLIENKLGYDLDELKEAFEILILEKAA